MDKKLNNPQHARAKTFQIPKDIREELRKYQKMQEKNKVNIVGGYNVLDETMEDGMVHIDNQQDRRQPKKQDCVTVSTLNQSIRDNRQAAEQPQSANQLKSESEEPAPVIVEEQKDDD